MLNINFFLLSSHFLLLKVEVKCKNFIHWYHKDVLVTFVILMVACMSRVDAAVDICLFINYDAEQWLGRGFLIRWHQGAHERSVNERHSSGSCSFMLCREKKRLFHWKKVRHYWYLSSAAGGAFASFTVRLMVFSKSWEIFFGIQEIFHALNRKVHLKSCSLNKSAQSALEINIIKFLHRQPPLSSTNKPQHRCLFRGIRIKNASICKNLKIYRIKESLRGLSKPFSQK